MHSQVEIRPLPVFSGTDGIADWFEPLPGERMRVRIGSDATGGRLTLLENMVTPGAAAPSHFHQDADELFIVVEGRFRITAGRREILADAGAAIFMDRFTVKRRLRGRTDRPSKPLGPLCATCRCSWHHGELLESGPRFRARARLSEEGMLP